MMWKPTIGKWADPSVPKTGCLRDSLYQLDKGKLPCEMCGELYRTLGTHGVMKHPIHPKVRVCMMCEDLMMDNVETWMARRWWPSKKGNPQLPFGDFFNPDFFVTLFRRGGGWSAVITEGGHDEDRKSEFLATTHATETEAKRAAFYLYSRIMEPLWKESEARFAQWAKKRQEAREAIRKFLGNGPKPRKLVEDWSEMRGGEEIWDNMHEGAGVLELIAIDHELYYRLTDKTKPRLLYTREYKAEWDAKKQRRRTEIQKFIARAATW